MSSDMVDMHDAGPHHNAGPHDDSTVLLVLPEKVIPVGVAPTPAVEPPSTCARLQLMLAVMVIVGGCIIFAMVVFVVPGLFYYGTGGPPYSFTGLLMNSLRGWWVLIRVIGGFMILVGICTGITGVCTWATRTWDKHMVPTQAA